MRKESLFMKTNIFKAFKTISTALYLITFMYPTVFALVYMNTGLTEFLENLPIFNINNVIFFYYMRVFLVFFISLISIFIFSNCSSVLPKKKRIGKIPIYACNIPVFLSGLYISLKAKGLQLKVSDGTLLWVLCLLLIFGLSLITAFFTMKASKTD